MVALNSRKFTGAVAQILMPLALSCFVVMAGMLAGNSAQAQNRPDIVIAVDNLWPTLEPAIGVATTNARVIPSIFDTIVRRNWIEDPFGGKSIPHLATEWKRKTDTIWEITLRRGVKFHNGEEMTAEDVAFTVSKERLWGEKPWANRSARYAVGIVRVEATGRYTV